jgi:hypothetical protein
VVVSAAPSQERGQHARRWVEEVVRMQGATVADSFTVARGDDPADGLARALDALDASAH